MNATPPEANTEYSRGAAPSGRDSAPAGTATSPLACPPASDQIQARFPEWWRGPASDVSAAAILAGGLLGALLLLVAEFTTLFEVHGRRRPRCRIRSVGTGSHHAYALVPIALLVARSGLRRLAGRAAARRCSRSACSA